MTRPAVNRLRDEVLADLFGDGPSTRPETAAVAIANRRLTVAPCFAYLPFGHLNDRP